MPRRFIVSLLRCLLVTCGFMIAGISTGQASDIELPMPPTPLAGEVAVSVTVIEPHESKPYKPVEITYKGYSVVPILDQLLGDVWRSPDALVLFQAKDGYVSMIPSARLLKYPAYLVYANAQGADFSVETPPLIQRVSLGPWYLVWDNVLYSELRNDGATYWPYQVERIGIVDRAELAKLMPPMLPERYREGSQLTQKFCLGCHQVNGVGGKKIPIDLGQWAASQSFARFATWVLDPASKNPLTGMPPLASDSPAGVRQLMARQIYGYLRAVGALSK